MTDLLRCVQLAGGPVALTRELNKRLPRPVTYQAVLKWVRVGRLPRTEWTGETAYAQALSDAVGGQVTREQLLAVPPAARPALVDKPAALPGQGVRDAA